MDTTSANLQVHENPLWELAKYIETSQNSVEKGMYLIEHCFPERWLVNAKSSNGYD